MGMGKPNELPIPMGKPQPRWRARAGYGQGLSRAWRPGDAPATMRLSRFGALALALALAGCAMHGRPLDTARLVAELGRDGAAEALRIRIAGDPTDVAARRALARLDVERGRPGAALEQYTAVWAIGGPIGARLDDAERRGFAELLRRRARARVGRGSPDAVADLDAARAIAGGEDAALRREAVVLLAIAELRSTDPERRADGARRIGGVADDRRGAIYRAIADPKSADVDALGAAGRFLWDRGARRIALERLDAWERGGGRGRGGPALAETVDDWVAARAWWRGAAGRPDLATLARAVAAGAWPCRVATHPGEHGCRAVSVLGNPARERELLARARERGWRTADPEEAAGWVALTAHAWARGEIPSWLDELDARVDLAALGLGPDGDSRLPPDLPAWARAPLLRAAGRSADRAARRDDDDVFEVAALERAIAGDAPEAAAPPPSPDAALLITHAIAPTDGGGLAEIVRAYRRAPAAADRVAEDVAGRDVDVAAVAPAIAEVFALLGDPARARAWYERAVETSPGDVGLRMGLVGALAAAGDGPAARLQLTTVAAGSGDAARALLDGARLLADAGLVVDALAPAKLALELTPRGDEGEVLALLVEVQGRLGREDQVRTLTAALAAARPSRDPSTLRARALAGDAGALARAIAVDPVDATLALAAAAAEPDDARAAAILARAARWNPNSVELRAALLARAPSPGTRDELARIAVDARVAPAVRAAAARVWLGISAAAAGWSRR